jgi:flagellar motor switch protein FliM
MAEKDVLSQEEIEALLENVDDNESADDANVETQTDEGLDNQPLKEEVQSMGDIDSVIQEKIDVKTNKKTGVNTIDFFNQERIVRGELPVLEKINDRAVRYFTGDIYQLMSHEMHVEQESLKILKYKDYMSSLKNPTYLSIFRFRPLRGKAMIIFDPGLVYELVDHYFGGSSQFDANLTRLDFTPTEIRIMDAVVEKLCSNIKDAWSQIVELEVIKIGGEVNPQLVNVSAPTDLVLVSNFKAKFYKGTNDFAIIIPYSMVEPIKQQLELGATSSDDDIDPNWIKSLRDEIKNVELTVSAVIGSTESSLGKVNELKVDDFIPLEVNEIVTLDIEDIPIFKATLGTKDEKSALKIISQIYY